MTMLRDTKSRVLYVGHRTIPKDVWHMNVLVLDKGKTGGLRGLHVLMVHMYLEHIKHNHVPTSVLSLPEYYSLLDILLNNGAISDPETIMTALWILVHRLSKWSTLPTQYAVVLDAKYAETLITTLDATTWTCVEVISRFMDEIIHYIYPRPGHMMTHLEWLRMCVGAIYRYLQDERMELTKQLELLHLVVQVYIPDTDFKGRNTRWSPAYLNAM
jgi:hypothetical protein